MTETKKKTILNAYGPNGEEIAFSSDGGKTWTELQKPKQKKPKPREFRYRIAAMINQQHPRMERRICTTFGPLHHAGILAGWAPYDDLLEMKDNALDAIILPGPGPDEFQLTRLRDIAPTLILDLDAPMVLDAEMIDRLYLALRHVDAVTVPTELVAQKLRSYHETVFVQPYFLRASSWEGYDRPAPVKGQPVTIGVGEQMPDIIESALEFALERVGEKAEIRRFNWWDYNPWAEPELYAGLDIVILPEVDRYQASAAPVLPALAGGCLVIADRFWPKIVHGKTGFQVIRKDARAWADQIITGVFDGRKRQIIANYAMREARRNFAESNTQRIARIYETIIHASRTNLPAQQA